MVTPAMNRDVIIPAVRDYCGVQLGVTVNSPWWKPIW